MPSIADIKSQYPELSGLDDNQVVDAIHQAFYEDLPRDQVAGALGVKPLVVAEKPQPRTMMQTIGDAGVTALKGAIGVPEAVVGMADLLSGGRVGRALENEGGSIGFRPKQAKAMLDDYYSEQQKQAFRNVSDADGVVGTAKAALENPSVIAHAVGESIPMIGMGGLIGRGVMAAAPRVGALGAGAVGEGVVAAGSAGEQIRQQTDDGLLTGKQAALGAATGAATGVFGVLGGKIAQRLGIADVDTMLAAAGANPAVRKGVVRSVLEGAASEGLLEELPQSVSEQVLQNIALNRPLDDGVDQAIVLGTLSGAAMGGGANAVNSFASGGAEARGPEPVPQPAPVPQPTPVPPVEPAGPMTKAVQALGFNPIAGTPVVFPDGSVALGSEAEQARRDELSMQSNIEQEAARRAPMPAGDAYNMLATAQERGLDYTVALHPSGGGFLVVPKQWITPQAQEAAASQLMETIGRMQQADAAPVERAERRRSEPVDLNLNTDPVAGYIEDLRKTNTPAARAYVGEFDAGRVTRADVEQRMRADRGLTADERLARAAAEGLKLNPKGDPFKTLMAANLAAKTTPGTVIEVPGGYAIRPQESTLANTAAQEVATADAEPVQAGEPTAAAPFADAADEAGGAAVSGSNEQGAVQALKPELADIQQDVMRGNAVTRLTKEEYDAIKAEQSNVQDAPKAANDTAAETPAVEAPAPERGDGAAASGVPDAGAGAGVRADGVSEDAPTAQQLRDMPIDTKEQAKVFADGYAKRLAAEAKYGQGRFIGANEKPWTVANADLAEKNIKANEAAELNYWQKPYEEAIKEYRFQGLPRAKWEAERKKRGLTAEAAAPKATDVQANGVAVSQPNPETQPEPSNGAALASQAKPAKKVAKESVKAEADQEFTPADAQAAERQIAQMIGDRIDAMQAQAVQKIGAKFLPTMGIKAPIGKAKIKAAVTDFTKVNPLAAASEFGVEMADSVRAPLLAQFEGRLVDAAKTAAPAQQEAQQTTDDRAKPEPVAPISAKVDDFGEKLPPARRAMAAKLSEELTDDAIASQPLSKVWPLEENEAIEDTFAAAVAHVMREAVPAKPRTSYKVKSWVSKVKVLRDFAAKILRGTVTKDIFLNELAKYSSLRDLGAKIKLLEQIDRAQWKRIGDVSEAPGAIQYVDGKAVPQPSASVTVDGKSHWFRNSGDINAHVDAIKAMLTGDAPESKLKFEVFRATTGDRKVFISKKGDKEYRRLMEFDTVEEARKALKDQYADLVAAWEGVKSRDNITERDLRTAENRPRTGKDHRKGRDISAEEFQQTFGFRGGEFGKWVSQGSGAQERQFMLNSAYDGLMDLADIIGVPPKALSLDGTLGIAFGSRSGGWASAHFEPSNLVINLTKPRGAGALAHEWFHALDNYFARKRGGEVPIGRSLDAQNEYRRNNYITHKTRPMMVRKDGKGSPVTRERLAEWRKSSPGSSYLNEDQWIEDPNHKPGVRAEVEERFDELVKALDASPMLKRARKIDGVKLGDGYWSRTLERAARAFENYIQVRMHEQGYNNDFLVNVKPAVDVGKSLDRYPYLLPSEVAPIADAFSNLFNTIQTKEEDGKTVMFSIDDDTPAFYSAIKREINRLPTNAAPAFGWLSSMQGLVKNGKVKADELEWSGLNEWLKLQTGKVSKEDVLAYLDANGVQVTETVLADYGPARQMEGRLYKMAEAEEAAGRTNQFIDSILSGASADEIARMAESHGGPDEMVSLAKRYRDTLTGDATPKYSQYTLPGGENYREVLLTLPQSPRKARFDVVSRKDKSILKKADSREEAQAWIAANAGMPAAKGAEVVERPAGAPTKTEYKSSHWDQPNVLAHIRVNDRTDAQGRKVLFVEELQSDWGQDAKKKGFAGRQMRLKAANQGGTQWEVTNDETGDFVGNYMALSEDEAISYAREDGDAQTTSNIPRAPFVDKTDKWLALSLKRIMKMAVDGGYDRVAFVTGEQSAERYDLSKQVSDIAYTKTGDDSYYIVVGGPRGGIHSGTHTASALEDYVGKELAQKIVDRATGDVQNLSGLDLKVGGEGMKAFYDKIVPAAVKDVLKKVGGGQMEAVQIGGTEMQNTVTRATVQGREEWRVWDANDNVIARFPSEREASDFIKAQGGGGTVQPGFTITDAMREKVAGGLPLFSAVDAQAKAGDTPTDENPVSVTVTQAHRDAIGRLQQRIRTRSGNAAYVLRPVESVAGPGREQAFAVWLAKAGFGATVIPVEQPAKRVFNGAQAGNLLLLDVNTTKPAVAVMGHELLHQLRRDDPGLYSFLKVQMEAVLKPGAVGDYAAMLRKKYADQGIEELTEDSVSEELIADIVGDQFGQRQFWDMLAAKSKNWAVKIARKALDVIDRLLGVDRKRFPFETDKYLTDIEAARKIVADVLAEYSGDKVGRGGDDSVKFSAVRGTNKAMPENQAPGPQGDAQQGANKGNAVAVARQLAQAIADDGDDTAVYGLRVIPGDVKQSIKPGDYLPPSNQWIDGEDTGEPLSGTSAVLIQGLDEKAAERAIRLAGVHGKAGPNGYYYGDQVVLIKGEKAGSGEDVGEVLIRDAVVVSTWKKPTKGNSEVIPNDQSAPVSGGAMENADIRFSVADDIKKAIPAFDVKTAPKNSWAHYRGMTLQALGRRHIVDLYAEELPQLEHYNDLVQQMDAEKNESCAEADKLAQDWGKLKDEKQLAELMHDATLAQIDPAKPMMGGALKSQYDAIKARFDALTPEAQDLYRQARDMYEGHYRKVQKAIKERIERSEMSAGQKRQIMARMDEELFKQLKGVYFPLARFGQYVIVVKDANGEVKNVTRAETVGEAEEARKELHKAFPKHMGYTVGKVLKQAEFNAGRDAVGKGFMADLMDALDAKGIDDELRDTVAQLYLSSLPDLSWAKHGIHRKGTPGFSQDARRAFAQNMFHGARYLAKLRYADQLQDELIAMQEHVKAYEGVDEYDSIQAQQVVDEMVKRHEIMMNPKSSPVSTALTSLGFVFHLGLSPASAMVNLSQTALVAYPMMGAKWGWGKASAALLSASQDVVKAKNDLGTILNGAELDAYERAVKDGTIDVTMAHDLAGISQGEDQKVFWKIRPVMRAASFMFHHAERFNRQATFIAAWRMAKEAGPDKTADQLYEEAKKLTYDSHFDYSACVDDATEILTESGWKIRADLRAGDIAIATDDAGKAVRSKVLAVNVYEGEKEVIEFKSSRKFSMVLTPNHDAIIQNYNSRDKKWQAIRKVRADELKNSHHIVRAPLSAIDREGVGLGEDMAALLGWIAAEGWYAKYRNCKQATDVRIGQSDTHNPEYVSEIRSLLQRLGGEFKEYTYQRKRDTLTTFVLRRSLGQKVQEAMPQKVLTSELVQSMSTVEMRAFIMAFLKGDGSQYENGKAWAVGQKNGANLDLLQAMATMCGMRATLSPVNGEGIALLYIVPDDSGCRSHVRPLEQVRRIEPLVWCPTTEHGTWIARRNGAVFVTGNSNRPRVMQGNWQRVIFLFKNYSQAMVYTLSRNAYLSMKGMTPADRALARKTLGGILATHAAAAGVLGLPLVGPLLTAASFIGSDDDEPWDAEVAMQNVMADMVGPKAAEVMARGFSRLTPFDLSGRVALNKLILPDVQEGLEGQRWAESAMAASLGPVAGIGVNMVRGLQKITDGHYMMGLEDMMPTALRGPLKAMRYASEGAVDKTGVVITDEVGPASVAGQALGFSPSEVRRATERKAAIMDYDRSLADRRSSLVRQWAEAQMAGDTDGVKDVMGEIHGFNQKNPNRKITMPNLIQSVRARRRRIEQAEDGVYLPKNREGAREAVRF